MQHCRRRRRRQKTSPSEIEQYSMLGSFTCTPSAVVFIRKPLALIYLTVLNSRFIYIQHCHCRNWIHVDPPVSSSGNLQTLTPLTVLSAKLIRRLSALSSSEKLWVATSYQLDFPFQIHLQPPLSSSLSEKLCIVFIVSCIHAGYMYICHYRHSSKTSQTGFFYYHCRIQKKFWSLDIAISLVDTWILLTVIVVGKDCMAFVFVRQIVFVNQTRQSYSLSIG